jgi:lipopolysaccharide transport system permease protein
MYTAPVVWSITQFNEKIVPVYGYWTKLAYGLYPMVGVIEGFRSSIIGRNPMPWDLLIMGAISAIILFISGAFYFKRMERLFADVA